MAKKTKISSLPAEKLGHLLGLCSENAKSAQVFDHDQVCLEALEDLLASVLPAESYDSSSVIDELSHLCDISGLAQGDPIRNILLDSQASVALLDQIRGFAKNKSKKAASEAEADATGVVYYAAIAGALVYHDSKISRLSQQKLQQTFAELAETNWVPSDLVELFKKAKQYCQNILVSLEKGELK